MTGLVTLLTVFLVGLSGALGCGSDDGDSPEGSSDPATTAQGTAQETAPTAPPEGQTEAEIEDPGRDLAGLRAVVNDDATIVLSGTNRWGERFETTYADLSYFEGAVPVWKRSISEDQGVALDAFLEELKAEAGPPAGSEEGSEEGAPETPGDEVGESSGAGGPGAE